MSEIEQEIATRTFEAELRRNLVDDEDEDEEWFECPKGGLVCEATCFYCQNGCNP